MEQRFLRQTGDFIPKLHSPKDQRNIMRTFMKPQPQNASGSMRASPRMWYAELLDSQHPLTRFRKLVTSSAAHAAHADDRNVERRHLLKRRQVLIRLPPGDAPVVLVPLLPL